MKYETLVLNSDYVPHRIISWQDAIVAIYSKDEKSAYIAVTYNKVIYDSMGRPYNLPAVIVLNRFLARNNYQAGFSKTNIHIRDRYQCQYCGFKCSPDYCNIEHIYPRSRPDKLPRGIKMNSYQNCITTCRRCNLKKANRLPEECNMHPIKIPKPITHGQKIFLTIKNRKNIPNEWLPYLESLPFND